MYDLGTGKPMETEFLVSVGLTHGDLKNIHHANNDITDID